MISKFLRVSTLILLVVAFAGCNGNDDDGPGEAPQVKLRAEIGGESFRTDDASGVLSNDGRLLTISATNELGNVVILQVGSFTDEGALITADTYAINEENLAFVSYTSGGITFTTDVEQGGFITISDLNEQERTVFGSFSAGLTSEDGGTITIQSGSLFNIGYTEQ